MKMAALLVALAVSVGASPVAVHPLIGMLNARPALRYAVASELRAMSGGPSPLLTGGSQAARQIALGLVAYRAELSPSALHEVLGSQEQAVVRSLQLDPAALAAIREQVPAHDRSGMARLQAGLDKIFDNARSLGLTSEGLPVVGSEGAGRQLLSPSPTGSGFKFQSQVILPEGQGFPGVFIEKGTAAGHPATHVGYRTGESSVAANVGKARTWAQAREKAQALGPGWDLPTRAQYMDLIMSAAFPDLKIRLGGKAEDKGYYPMWMRADEAGDDSMLADSSVIMGMSDGTGTDIDPLDISAQTQQEMREELRRLNGMLARREHRTREDERKIQAALAKKMPNGWLNPDVQHAGLPKSINALLAKPRRKAILESAMQVKNLLAAIQDGYVVYAVHQSEPPELAPIEGPLN